MVNGASPGPIPRPEPASGALTRSQRPAVQGSIMPTVPLPRQSVPPALLVAALMVAAMLAAALPGGRWSDTLALFASAAALFAAQERRPYDMIAAAGIAAGLAPAGLLLAPLCLGVSIRQGAARRLPLAAVAAMLVHSALPWSVPMPTLPNLAMIAATYPDALALIAAIGTGTGAWLAARASIAMPGDILTEAKWGAILLAGVLPLPVGALGAVLILAALPLPSRPRLHAANDNIALPRRRVRLAA